MSKSAIRSSLVLMMFVLLSITGCDKVGGLFSVPIKDVLNNPREYEGKSITIAGTVGEPVSLILVKAYTLYDDTGKIVVVTERILPHQGEKITVKGSVDTLLEFGGKNVTVFREAPLEKK